MQVHHGEGVVTHIGPEPCVDIREGTGLRTSGSLSSKAQFFVRDLTKRVCVDTCRIGNGESFEARHGFGKSALLMWRS